jgi:putative DNA primase/helicase
VVICEGEKSAHAAARIFPDSVCVTSPGGSGAEAQADWTPLAGRKVLIWPDCDMTGAKYAGRVAHFLHDRQCEVSIIDAAALASLSPNGGKREPTKKGWDAADAGDEWQDLDALRRAAHEFAKEPPLVAKRDHELGKPDEIDLEISRLAKLRTVDYEQVRKEATGQPA